MDKELIQINTLKFEIEELNSKKGIKTTELIKKDSERLNLNTQIVSLKNEIKELKKKKYKVEEQDKILRTLKEEAKFGAFLFSAILIIFPSIVMTVATKDTLALIISLIFSSVVSIPTSVIFSFQQYFKFKKELKHINLDEVEMNINTKEKALSLVEEKHDIKESEIEKLKDEISEIVRKISELVNEKNKIESIRFSKNSKLNNEKNNHNYKKTKQKKLGNR